MARRQPLEQLDFFEKPPREDGGEESSSPPPEEPPGPVDEERYESTPEDEQARLEMEHGPGVRYIPPKSREEREAEERRLRAMQDDALGRMGVPGKQLLSDTESPFARGEREEEERKRRK